MSPATPTQLCLARGKPAPNPLSEADSSADAPPARTEPPSDELHVEREDRDLAARVLGSWELLSMWASANTESIPQTRRRFEKKLLGLSEEESAEGDEWEDCFDEEVMEGGEEARKRDSGVGERGDKGEAEKKG